MNLLIEVTRECNLKCEHCLRGKAESKSIQEKDIISLFKQIQGQEIYSLTLTGGEPALRPDKIQMILDIAKEYNIDIFSFYIATNGTIASDNFLRVLMELYLYCSDNETSCVEISNDSFHNMDLIKQNQKKFEMFSFTKFKFYPKNSFGYEYENLPKFPDYEHDYEDFNSDMIINQGRGKDWGDKNPFVYEKEDFNPYDIDDIELYLNCNGDIILGCDWSYEEQENHKFCHVTEFQEYINRDY
jgi:organic radical activating enzyme